MKNIFRHTSLTLHFSVSYIIGGGPREEKAKETEKKRDKKGAGNRGRVDRRVGERISQPEGKGGREGGEGRGLSLGTASQRLAWCS